MKRYFADAAPGVRLAANLSLLYQEMPLEERFGACAEDGFRAVEILFPYDISPNRLDIALRANGLELVLVNTPAGDLAAGDRGLLGQPGRQQEFRDALDRALEVASVAGCKRIHLMMGCADGPDDGADSALQGRHGVILENLHHASDALQRTGMVGLLEPINRRDIPGYLLNRQSQAVALLKAVGSKHLGLQMDMYHCQIAEGDVTTRLRENFGQIGHIQIAGVPSRNEPGTSELDYAHVFAELTALGYDGWIGCEYKPADATPGGTTRGLSWVGKAMQGLLPEQPPRH